MGTYRKCKLFFLVACVCTLLLFGPTEFLNAQTTDSTKNRASLNLWYPAYLPLPADSIKIQLKGAPTGRILPKINFFSGKYMTSDPFKLDYRESSYYIPNSVRDEIARGMNRPSPGSFVPVLGVAYLAARMALHYVTIQEKIRITAMDYLKNERYLAILKILWKKSPQTVYELYKQQGLNKNYTLIKLKQALNELEKGKLIKIRRNPNKGRTLYFPAQSPAKALLTLEQAIDNVPLSAQQRSRLVRMIEALK